MKKKTWIYILLAVIACVGVAAAFIYRHMVKTAVDEEDIPEQEPEMSEEPEPVDDAAA